MNTGKVDKSCFSNIFRQDSPSKVTFLFGVVVIPVTLYTSLPRRFRLVGPLASLGVIWKMISQNAEKGSKVDSSTSSNQSTSPNHSTSLNHSRNDKIPDSVLFPAPSNKVRFDPNQWSPVKLDLVCKWEQVQQELPGSLVGALLTGEVEALEGLSLRVKKQLEEIKLSHRKDLGAVEGSLQEMATLLTQTINEIKKRPQVNSSSSSSSSIDQVKVQNREARRKALAEAIARASDLGTQAKELFERVVSGKQKLSFSMVGMLDNQVRSIERVSQEQNKRSSDSLDQADRKLMQSLLPLIKIVKLLKSQCAQVAEQSYAAAQTSQEGIALAALKGANEVRRAGITSPRDNGDCLFEAVIHAAALSSKLTGAALRQLTAVKLKAILQERGNASGYLAERIRAYVTGLIEGPRPVGCPVPYYEYLQAHGKDSLKDRDYLYRYCDELASTSTVNGRTLLFGSDIELMVMAQLPLLADRPIIVYERGVGSRALLAEVFRKGAGAPQKTEDDVEALSYFAKPTSSSSSAGKSAAALFLKVSSRHYYSFPPLYPPAPNHSSSSSSKNNN